MATDLGFGSYSVLKDLILGVLYEPNSRGHTADGDSTLTESTEKMTSGPKPIPVAFTLFINVSEDARPSGRGSPYPQSAMSHRARAVSTSEKSALVTANVRFYPLPPLAPGFVQDLLEISITRSVPRFHRWRNAITHVFEVGIHFHPVIGVLRERLRR